MAFDEATATATAYLIAKKFDIPMSDSRLEWLADTLAGKPSRDRIVEIQVTDD